jgi:hypothetical protein
MSRFKAQVLTIPDRYSHKGYLVPKTPYVLLALQILGLEEILKLSKVLNTKKIPLKKAVGQDLIVWDEDDLSTKKETVQEEAKILLFSPPTEVVPLAPTSPCDTKTQQDESSTQSDLYIWHREINKQSSEKAHQKEALQGYKKTTEIYVIKTKDDSGKTQFRYASTEGVLINKKQA